MLTCLLMMTISMLTERKEMQNSGPNSGMHPICICYTHRDLFLVRVLFPKHQIDERRRGRMREGEERGVGRGMGGQRNP